MDNASLQKLSQALEKNQNIGIAVGKNPTVDTMAAALSLYLSLGIINKKAMIVSPSQALVEHSSLVGVDKVKSGFEGDSGDLVVSFPYREGEIEKVSYTIESGFLNIVVKSGEQGLNFNEQDVRFKRGGGMPSLLFVIGTPVLTDLGNLYDPEAMRGTAIVNIDSNPENQGYGDIVLVEPKFSSVSELMANILVDLRIEPDVDTAQNLLNGISSATDNFQDPRAGFTAFEIAGYLMKRGASRSGGTRRQMPRRDERLSAAPRPQPFADRQQQMPRPAQMPQRPMPQRPMQQPMSQPMQDNFPRVDTMAQDNAPMPNYSRQNPPRQRGVQDIQDELARQVAPPRPSFGQDDTQIDQPQEDKKPPSDWLTPKVYKGSSNV